MLTKIAIWKERCKGCNVCVTFCPKKILALDSLAKIYITDDGVCVQCGRCEMLCSDFAIRVNKEENQ